VTARSKVWVCRCSHAGIAGSNTAEGMDACLLWVLCDVSVSGRADQCSRGVLPSVLFQCDNEDSVMRSPWPTRCCCVIKTSGILAYTASVEGWIIKRKGFSVKQSWPIRHTKSAFVLLLLLLKYPSFADKQKTSAFKQMDIFRFYTCLTELQASTWM